MHVHMSAEFLDRTWLELNPNPLGPFKARSLGALALTLVDEPEKWEIERLVPDEVSGTVDAYLRPKTYPIPEQQLSLEGIF